MPSKIHSDLILKKTQYSINNNFLLFLGAILLGGLIILQAASSVSGYLDHQNVYYYFTKQLLSGVIPGGVLFILCSLIPPSIWKRFSIIIFGIVIIINTAIIIPGLGDRYLGATRWISIGGFSFQPSELLKLALVIYFAMILEKLGHTLNSRKGILLVMGLIGICVAIVAIGQSNLSTALLLIMIAGGMLLVSPMKLQTIVMISLIGIILAAFFALSTPYRRDRVATFFDDTSDPLGKDYHIQQNLIAVGSGGILGLGWNQSRQKYNYVPEASSDSIFAIFAEELGLVGITVLLFLYGGLLFNMLSIAKKNTHLLFNYYSIIGFTIWILVQIFLNIGATIRLIPLTGVPLPFISAGNSSLISLLIAMGIVASMSKSKTLSS